MSNENQSKDLHQENQLTGFSPVLNDNQYLKPRNIKT